MEIDWLAILTSLGVVVGLAGTVLPVLPGMPLVFASIFVYAAGTGFRVISGATVAWMLALTLVGMALEYGLGLAAARRRGASRAALWGALAGAIVGTLWLGPIGLLAGPLAGAMLGELISGRPFRQAWSIGWVTVIGTMVGILLELGIGLGMAIYFWLRIF